jgi:hypothetical protein
MEEVQSKLGADFVLDGNARAELLLLNAEYLHGSIGKSPRYRDANSHASNAVQKQTGTLRVGRALLSLSSPLIAPCQTIIVAILHFAHPFRQEIDRPTTPAGLGCPIALALLFVESDHLLVLLLSDIA